MPEPVTIGYFLEDTAHERFFTALIQHVAQELGIEVISNVRNASGGKGRTMTELRNYLRDVRAGRDTLNPILVVAIDGNCTTYQAKRDEIKQIKEQTGYSGEVVCAVPDPHIERWYLADAEGFKQAIEGSRPPAPPTYKCERGRYKEALREAFRAAQITPQLGGAEYAADIVVHMDLYRAGQTDTAFKHFVDDLRATLMRHTREQCPV